MTTSTGSAARELAEDLVAQPLVGGAADDAGRLGPGRGPLDQREAVLPRPPPRDDHRRAAQRRRLRMLAGRRVEALPSKLARSVGIGEKVLVSVASEAVKTRKDEPLVRRTCGRRRRRSSRRRRRTAPATCRRWCRDARRRRRRCRRRRVSLSGGQARWACWSLSPVEPVPRIDRARHRIAAGTVDEERHRQAGFDSRRRAAPWRGSPSPARAATGRG